MQYVFEREKRGVAFIHVVNRGLQANRLQGTVAANTKYDLLPDSRLAVPAVQLVGNTSVFGTLIGGYVRIEQIQRHPSNLHFPNLRVHQLSGKVHFDANGTAVRVINRADREIVKIVVLVRFLLPPRLAQILAKVALLVEQSYAD